MIRIPNITFALDSVNYSSDTRPCRIEISCNPVDDACDIKSISYKCITQTDTYMGVVDPEILESLTSNLEIETDDEVWNSRDMTTLCLLERFDKMMLTLEDGDIYNMMSPCTTIWDKIPPRDKKSVHQAFVDVFLAEVSLYLVICDLLYNCNLWEIFPFNWELPYDRFDGRMLTRGAIRYMSHPIASAGALSSDISVGLSWMMVHFTNSHSISFREGDDLNLTRLIQDITLAVTKHNYASIREDKKEMEDRTLAFDIKMESNTSTMISLQNTMNDVSVRLEDMNKEMNDRINRLEESLRLIEHQYADLLSNIANVNEMRNTRVDTTLPSEIVTPRNQMDTLWEITEDSDCVDSESNGSTNKLRKEW